MHLSVNHDESHFISWVKIFTTTVDDLFIGEMANEAKRRGTLMAALFNSKLDNAKKIAFNSAKNEIHRQNRYIECIQQLLKLLNNDINIKAEYGNHTVLSNIKYTPSPIGGW